MRRTEHGQRRTSPSTLFPLALLAVLLGGTCEADSSHDTWSYDTDKPNGPLGWPNIFETCKGNYQSPIDLTNAKDSGNTTDLHMHGYDRILKDAVLVNNGHTVQLSSKWPGAWLSGGCLGDHRYYFEQLHFHWGSNDSRGSEHTLNGKSFPMEGHFVHRNGKYHSVKDAALHQDGLAVLGVFYQISEPGLERIKGLVNALRKVDQVGPDHDVSVEHSLALRDLLPKDLSSFYCYHRGSLTTPTCNQAVTWTVLEKTAPISSDQIGLFRKLRYKDNKPMVNNYRPVQSLNGRTIYFHSSPATRLMASSILHIIFFFVLSELMRLSG